LARVTAWYASAGVQFSAAAWIRLRKAVIIIAIELKAGNSHRRQGRGDCTRAGTQEVSSAHHSDPRRLGRPTEKTDSEQLVHQARSESQAARIPPDTSSPPHARRHPRIRVPQAPAAPPANARPLSAGQRRKHAPTRRAHTPTWEDKYATVTVTGMSLSAPLRRGSARTRMPGLPRRLGRPLGPRCAIFTARPLSRPLSP
jgi:hypothetical protein